MKARPKSSPSVAPRPAPVLLVLALGWYFYWDGQLEELSMGEQEELRLREAYKSKVQQAVNLDALRKQKEQVGEYVATLEK